MVYTVYEIILMKKSNGFSFLRSNDFKVTGSVLFRMFGIFDNHKKIVKIYKGQMTSIFDKQCPTFIPQKLEF